MSEKKLTTIIIEESNGTITAEVLQNFFLTWQRTAKNGLKFGQYLVNQRVITEDHLAKCLAIQAEVPFVDINVDELDKSLANEMPRDFAQSFQCFVYEKNEGQIKVAVENPYEAEIKDWIREKTKRDPVIVVASESKVRRALATLYEDQDVAQITAELSKEFQISSQVSQVQDATHMERLLLTLVGKGYSLGASDIHIQPEDKGIQIRMRIDGVMKDVDVIEPRLLAGLISVLKQKAGLRIEEMRQMQSGQAKFNIQQQSKELRVEINSNVYGEGAVMRLANDATSIPSINNLGLPNEDLELLLNAMEKPGGLILMTGPTGSGKTTTLYSILQQLNTPSKKIFTIENPVEIRIPGVDQHQINEKVSGFGAYLRSAMRCDPDVILVGEIRDEETAKAAVDAALTGHLVLSTLHVNQLHALFSRLTELKVNASSVAQTISLAVSQRLIRKSCPHCATNHELTALDRRWLTWALGHSDFGNVVKKSKGCSRCTDGFKGRLAVHEMVPFTEEIQEAITTGHYTAAVKEWLKNRSMAYRAGHAVLNGITTIEEAKGAVGGALLYK